MRYSLHKGDIAVRLDRKSYVQFNKHLLSDFKPKSLVEKIRANAGYGPEDLEPSTRPMHPRQSFFRNVESIIQTILATTGGMERRASGNPESSHSLRALLVAVALKYFDSWVYTTAMHDFGEYVNKGHPIKFVIDGKEQSPISRLWELNAFVERQFGTDVMLDLIALTRKPEHMAEKNWEEPYRDIYLPQVRERIAASFAKKIDSKINLAELDIRDKAKRKEKIRNAILKVAWQVPDAQRTAFLLAELLLADMERLAKGTPFEGLEGRLRMLYPAEGGPSPYGYELEKFKRGYALCPPREYSDRVLQEAALSGSPVITVYATPGIGYELELPFMDEIRALEVARGVFGDVKEKFNPSMLPYNLCHATILELEEKYLKQKDALNALVEAYDDALRRHNIMPGFDRKEYHEAAEQKWKDYEAKGKGSQGTLAQGSAGGQELQAQPGSRNPLDKALQAARRISLFFSIRPLEEGRA